ncbi:MAG: DoxX family membrane protein [Acidobacteria bacterium]|nr:DoxX family membrane protein [Acidobacteriota bacterium]
MTIRIIHWICRLVLAGIFIYSGYVKAQEPLQFAVAISGYQVVPEHLVFPVATYFPWFEIALGVLLLSGWKIRYSSIATAGLLLFFIGLITVTYMRGIEADCGCFGFGEPITAKTIFRDALFLIPALFLVFEPWIKVRFRDSQLSRSADSPA